MENSLPWDGYYPRPRLMRENWLNLNGSWDFYVGNDPEKLKIMVPYPPESRLSGYGKRIPNEADVTYVRTFSLPEGFRRARVLLHFGAVDQTAEVWLNGCYIGTHEGGYTHFTFDITEQVKAEDNHLTVRVTDHLSDKRFPYGKQKHKNGGMWYTPVTGIWQTVWVESVPETYIQDVKVTTNLHRAEFTLVLNQDAEVPAVLTVNTDEGPANVPFEGGKAVFDYEKAEAWSPEHPKVYECTVRAGEDEISSYFAFRTLSVSNISGIPRLCLNDRPYFFHGVLDQGYFEDGIFTPKDPESYRNDLMLLKSCGFNMLRKHIKIEPDYFYYLCDVMGLVVFQDMVNNGEYKYFRDTILPTLKQKNRKDQKLNRDPETRSMFKQTVKETIDQVSGFPCICYYTIFNEGWGQFESSEMYRYVKSLDQSRFVDSASGWFKGGQSDVISEHIYFKDPVIETGSLPYVLSEYGGYTFRTEGHLYRPEKAYGYGAYKTKEDYRAAVERLMEEVILPQVEKGLCADIYTQISDVEEEINGLITYDRQVIKVNPLRMREIAEKMKAVYEAYSL